MLGLRATMLGLRRMHSPRRTPSGGLVCDECGRTFSSLGLHACRGHGMTAYQYRERHRLQRTAERYR
jgi:predicted transcriptional regulator